MKAVTPAIREFPKDDRIWRLDWLGPIQKNPSHQSIEPLIAVIISPVTAPGNPCDESSIDENQRQVIHAGAGLLPYLRVGTLWHNGHILPQAAGTAATLQHVEISPETCRRITLAQRDPVTDNRYYVVPPYKYKVGKVGLGSEVWAIRKGDDPYAILLPAIEVLRFYYGGSTALTSLAIAGAYENYLHQIINPYESGFLPEFNRCVLRLRRWIFDTDGWIIGRVLHSPIARAGVKRVFDSILYRLSRGMSAYPSCGFPFQGETRWNARGLWFQSYTGTKRFLIFELTRCSAPFPFDELHVTRDNDGQKANEKTDIPETEKQPGWVMKAPSEDGPPSGNQTIQNNNDPNQKYGTVSITQVEARFDALENKEIIKTEKEEAPYKGIRLGSLNAITPEDLSTGPPHHGGSQVGPLVIQTIHRRAGAEPSFEFMLRAAQLLDEEPDMHASMRTAGYEHSTIPLTKPHDKRQWSYLSFEAGETRCIWAIDIRHKGVSHCFVDYEMRRKGERSAGLIRRADGAALSDFDFNALRWCIAQTEGNWRKKEFAQHEFQVTPRKHTWSNGEELAGAIKLLIQSSQ